MRQVVALEAYLQPTIRHTGNRHDFNRNAKRRITP
jgi:hypothetical protein